MRQVDGVRLTEGFDAADDTRVIDQRDMGELFVSLRVQPLLKPCAGLVTVSQVLLPLQQSGSSSFSKSRQRITGLA